MKKINITTDELIQALASYMKSYAKNAGINCTYMHPLIRISNWWNGEHKWSYDEVTIGEDKYTFNKESIVEKFADMVQQALDSTKLNGLVKTCECCVWDGRKYKQRKEFNNIILFNKCCKEYDTLKRLIEKYTKLDIQYGKCYSVCVCGKRDSWSESDDFMYLDYSPVECQKAIDFIRENRTSRDTISCRVEIKMEHNNEYDYKTAIRNESEWYGTSRRYLVLEVRTPKGKLKASLEVKPW